jgi:hypothetical protein
VSIHSVQALYKPFLRDNEGGCLKKFGSLAIFTGIGLLFP